MAKSKNGSIQLWHDQSTAMDTSLTNTNFTNYQSGVNKAFNPTAIGSSLTSTAFNPSGYQYFVSGPPTTLISVTDYLVLADNASILPIQFVTPTDYLSLFESCNPQGPTATTDYLTLVDIPKIIINWTFVDALALFESCNAQALVNISASDYLTLAEIWGTQLNVIASDFLSLVEQLKSITANVSLADYLSLFEQVKANRNIHSKTSLAVEVKHQYASKFSTTLNVMHYAPAPVNVPPSNDGTFTYPYSPGAVTYTPPAGGPAYPTVSPFDPTVKIGGTTVYQGASTAISGLPNNAFVFNTSQMVPACDYVSSSLNMSINSEGSFSLRTAGSKPVQQGGFWLVYGIYCLCTGSGPIVDNKPGFQMQGLVGNARDYNKQLLLVLGSSSISKLAPNTPLQAAPSQQWTTVSSLATYLGAMWYANDAALFDTFLETGMTVLGAIRSLASRVGAFITFDGYNIIVFSPDQGYGYWAGPNCKFMQPSGVSEMSILDISDGILTLALKPVEAGTVTEIDTLNPLIDTIRSYSSAIDVQGPARYIPVPGDVKKTYIRILVKDSSITSDNAGGQTQENGINPASAIVVVPEISQQAIDAGSTFGNNTFNDPGLPAPNQQVGWIPYPLPVIQDSSASNAANNGAVSSNRHFYILRSSDFPSNLTDGQFTFEVGYERDQQSVNDAFDRTFEQAVEQNKLYSQYQQETMRYIPTKRWVLNFKFFGSLPIPGNMTSFSYNGITGAGMVESVSVNNYDVTVTVASYQRLDLISPQGQLDYFLATGQTT